MGKAFDPYEKWLGIPASDRPVNYYRLLGVELFETDASVITDSAERKMVLLHSFQTGKNAEWSQKLLNEVAEAKICLLNARKKLRYDHRLKKKLAAAPVNSVEPQTPPKSKREQIDDLLPPPVAQSSSTRATQQPVKPPSTKPPSSTTNEPSVPAPSSQLSNSPLDEFRAMGPPQIQSRIRRQSSTAGWWTVLSLLLGVGLLAGVFYWASFFLNDSDDTESNRSDQPPTVKKPVD